MATATKNKRDDDTEPAVEAPPPVVTPGFVPRRIADSTDPRFEQREPLCFVGDRCFTIPVAFPGSVLLQFNYLSARLNVEVAIDWALSTALGDGDYGALRASKAVTDDDVLWIRDQILARILGKARS